MPPIKAETETKEAPCQKGENEEEVSMNHCESCKFFEPNSPQQGACRRMPPVPFATGPDQVTSAFPTVQQNSWCGEWAIRLVIAGELPPRRIVQ